MVFPSSNVNRFEKCFDEILHVYKVQQIQESKCNMISFWYWYRLFGNDGDEPTEPHDGCALLEDPVHQLLEEPAGAAPQMGTGVQDGACAPPFNSLMTIPNRI